MDLSGSSGSLSIFRRIWFSADSIIGRRLKQFVRRRTKTASRRCEKALLRSSVRESGDAPRTGYGGSESDRPVW